MNTNGIYDGITYVTIDKAVNQGSLVIDYSSQSNIYSATLNNTIFNIYPYEPFIGEFIIISSKVVHDSEILNKEINTEKALEYYCNCKSNDKSKSNMDTTIQENYVPYTSTDQSSNIYIYVVCLFLVLIAILILCFYGEFNKKK